MADITLGDLLTLVLQDLADTVEQTADQTRALGLHVGDVNLEIPAYLHVDNGSATAPEDLRLRVALPSTREAPPPNRLGRIRITIAAQSGAPSEGPPA